LESDPEHLGGELRQGRSISLPTFVDLQPCHPNNLKSRTKR
jgi:hypothetical protein